MKFPSIFLIPILLAPAAKGTIWAFPFDKKPSVSMKDAYDTFGTYSERFAGLEFNPHSAQLAGAVNPSHGSWNFQQVVEVGNGYIRYNFVRYFPEDVCLIIQEVEGVKAAFNSKGQLLDKKRWEKPIDDDPFARPEVKPHAPDDESKDNPDNRDLKDPSSLRDGELYVFIGGGHGGSVFEFVEMKGVPRTSLIAGPAPEGGESIRRKTFNPPQMDETITPAGYFDPKLVSLRKAVTVFASGSLPTETKIRLPNDVRRIVVAIGTKEGPRFWSRAIPEQKLEPQLQKIHDLAMDARTLLPN